ncbi:GAP family protein [Mycobacterium sp. 141]|uniref:GAP family protein n=1 Tax=Mycobacterium sp. 141 TaxID=1120797 RepID=UPI000372CE93|nr:GAP family protein [Mycobacterium sp. 141]
MWITPLLVMAAAVSLEPFRLGMTVLMLNRPRPLLQLVTFLAGGFAMGILVGVTALFVLRPALGSAHFALPRVQMAAGVIVLLVAAAVAVGLGGTKAGRRGQLATRTSRLMEGHSLWIAGVAGLGIALPSVDYLAALTIIIASGAAAATQVGALLLFNVVAFGLVEIPLICYLVAPDRTRAMLSALHDWLRARHRREAAALLATVGCVLFIVGFVGL